LALTFQYAEGPGTRGENSMLSTSAPNTGIGGMSGGSGSSSAVGRFLVVVRKRDRNETDFLVGAIR
jgi:hypothetical protein